jgi:hypothetical protein
MLLNLVIIQQLNLGAIEMSKKTYKDFINDKFSFLKYEYGFELISCVDDPSFYKLVFKNATTGVAITYEYRDANISIYLYRLINGQIVEDKTPLSKDTQLNSIELSYIVQYRDVERITKPLYDSAAISFEDMISSSVNNLNNLAGDVLNGQFEVFSEINEIAKKRRLEWQNS